MSTEMKEYRGIEVEVATIGKCYVAHVDRTKGITFNNSEDKEIWCLNRKQFLRNSGYATKNRTYHEIFSHTVNGIENGFVQEFLHYSDTGTVTYHDSEDTMSMYCSGFDCSFK